MATTSNTLKNATTTSEDNTDAIKSDENADNTRVFTKFTCTRQATKMFTPDGARISFINHQYLTDNENIIAYLRAEIAAGARFIKEEGTVTSEDLDPMNKLRKKFFEEFKAEQEAARLKALAGDVPDMGSYSTPKLNPASSKNVAK